MLDTQARLAAVEDIRRLKARRLRALDAKDWQEYAALHVSDHVSDSYGGAVMRGNSENVAHLAALLAGVTTIHQVGAHEITIASEAEASGIWAMEDRLFWTQRGEAHFLHGWGHYHERYRFEAGNWRFAYRRLERVRVETSSGADLALKDSD